MKRDIEEIVRKYADMVYRLAYSHTGNKEDAEDIFQEVFVKLMKYMGGIDNEEHLKYWLIRVTINCANSLHSSKWKQNVTVVEHLPETEKAEFDIDEKSTVYEMVCALPEKYRSVLHLFYYEELSIREIAKVKECREGTVKSLLSRGRKMLEKKLKEEGYDD